MRRLADAPRVRRLLAALGQRVTAPARVYLTGGATAVLVGWRDSTVDADLLFEPESEAAYRALSELKESLEMNVELANPAHFVPELPGWRDRSVFIAQEGALRFYHYDPYAQVLAKIERGHAKDLVDAREMVRRGLVEPERLAALFEAVQPGLHRYPAVDPPTFRRRLQEFLAEPR
jgi:hypothetical protein